MHINETIDRLRHDAIKQNDGGGRDGWCRVRYGDVMALLNVFDMRIGVEKMATVAEILKYNRTEIYGLTLQQAADLLGTSKGQVHELESGETKDPRLSTVAKLCDVYKISPAQLMRCANVT